MNNLKLINSSWDKLINESKDKGLAFVGSVWGKSFDDIEQPPSLFIN